MRCPSKLVFELLHDYSRRLEWDTLLSEASLTRGCTHAAKGATSLCVSKLRFGRIGIETKYVTYSPYSIAAVEMINHPPWFETFAASIRHTDTPEGSEMTYKFRFSAKPRMLRWIAEPIMLLILRAETKRRLQALSAFLATQPVGQGGGGNSAALRASP